MLQKKKKNENYLAHYGVKGMKWGIRRTPEQLGHKTKKSTSETKKNTSKTKTSDKEYGVDPAAAVFLSLWATEMLAITAGPAIATGVKYCKNKGYEKERKNAERDPKTGLKLKSKKMDYKSDVKRVNPQYYKGKDEVTHNCMLCTTTYDLRRRGYDVTAAKTESGFATSQINKWYPKAKINTVSGKDEYGRYSSDRLREKVMSELSSQGEGARGNIMVNWKNTYSGHSMAYEVINGKVTIIDAQTGKSNVDSKQLFSNCADGVTYARLDNVDFDPKQIKGCVEDE